MNDFQFQILYSPQSTPELDLTEISLMEMKT